MKRVAVAIGLGLASFSLSAEPPAPAGARARPPAAPRAERPVPFHVGETLTYDVSWSSYLTAGTAVATVKEKKASSNSGAYYIVAEGRPAPLVAKLYSLYYKVDTLLDSYTLLPQHGSIYSEEGHRHRFRVTTFDRARQKATYASQAGNTVTSSFAVSRDVQDALSAIYVIRAIPFKAGDRMSMPVADSGTTYNVHLEVAPPERVTTPLGDLRAWRVKPSIADAKGQPVGRNTWLWISDDARRLPVKLQTELAVGSFNLILRDVR